MKCFTSYQRLTADTISGEQIIVRIRYSTFDKQEMDTFEKIIKQAIGSGVVTEIKVEGSDEE